MTMGTVDTYFHVSHHEKSQNEDMMHCQVIYFKSAIAWDVCVSSSLCSPSD